MVGNARMVDGPRFPFALRSSLFPVLPLLYQPTIVVELSTSLRPSVVVSFHFSRRWRNVLRLYLFLPFFSRPRKAAAYAMIKAR